MIKKISLLSFIFCSIQLIAQKDTIYSKSYGQHNRPAVIFIHGGPSGNATLFEVTTAQKLAEKGFYVIVYDRRGEGRSIDSTATFTFDEAIKDLNSIYKKYKINKANIIAHSFGGIVATLYIEKYPDKVNSLVLAGALFSQQETYYHILNVTRDIYRKNNDSLMLTKITKVEQLNKNSSDYRYECYNLAFINNFFKMPYPSSSSIELRNSYEQSAIYKNNSRNQQAPILFYRNEKRNNIDTKPILNKIKKTNVKLYAIYGNDDEIFSKKQMEDMRKIVTNNHFKMIKNCSHYLFVDQQEEFINAILKWIKRKKYPKNNLNI